MPRSVPPASAASKIVRTIGAVSGSRRSGLLLRTSAHTYPYGALRPARGLPLATRPVVRAGCARDLLPLELRDERLGGAEERARLRTARNPRSRAASVAPALSMPVDQDRGVDLAATEPVEGIGEHDVTRESRSSSASSSGRWRSAPLQTSRATDATASPRSAHQFRQAASWVSSEVSSSCPLN